MRVSKRASAAALGVAFALVATGCSSGKTGGSAGTANGAITLEGCQPENGLVPSNTTETCGGKVIDNVFEGLVRYPNDGSAPVNAAAESIQTTDSKVYTVKLKKGMKFHDGSEVQAKNFVDAWNWAAYSPNGAKGGTFFNAIQGYADVHTEAPKQGGPAPQPKAKTMSGLEIVDNYTFKVTLAAPFSIFPTMLGYAAFYPLPDAFFTQGADTFGKKPIGNGRMKFVSWTDNAEIKLTRFDNYTLDDKVKVKDATYRLYQDLNAAYTDLVANNLDAMYVLPTSALAGDKYKTDLGARSKSAATPSTAFIAFPLYDKRFQNADLRKAISYAIDRQSISDKIFFGTRKPATSWSNPLTPGDVANSCTVCKYDPVQAKALLAKAGGFTGDLVLFYNGDGGHKEWMEATAQSIKNTLGINARAEAMPTFAAVRQAANAHKLTGMVRAAWQQDYPDVEDWIGPLYVTGGSSNDSTYSNPQVDALYKEGTSAATVEAAHAKFAAAIKIVDQEVPVIPIYYYGQQAGWSTKIKSLQTTNVGEIDLASVVLN
jgi:oligopeptide transport system substrate-binding protein